MLRIYSAAEEKKFKEDSNAQTADPSMSTLGANWAPNTSKYIWRKIQNKFLQVAN